jgi:hypothetical protein
MHRVSRSRILLAFATLVATAAPVIAAGLPACCVPASAQAVTKPSCCAAKNAPCCKTPEAPKPDAAAKHQAPSLAAAQPSTGSTLVAVLAPVPTLASVRVARHEHRAPTPDDSPPDLLARHHVLLI